MFNSIIRFVLSHRVFVAVLYIFLILGGIYSTSQLPIDVLPDLNKPRVTVFADADGLGAEEMEKIVTAPLERILTSTPGVESVRSSSAQGLSVINIDFGWNTDNLINRQQIFERTRSANLPSGVHVSIAPESALLGEIMWIGLSAESASMTQADLKSYAETIVRQEIASVPGVSSLLIMGGSTKQYMIALDPQKVALKKLTLTDIEKSLTEVTNPG